jgi:hypothetical protein
MSASENSRPARNFELLIALLLLVLLSAAAVIWVHQRGYTLYFGDAEAHLNLARRVADSRTPGPSQIGAVWLPVPHILMLPFVRYDSLWHSGLAGAIPAALCFIAAGLFLFATARRVYGTTAAAATTLCVFALNPNLLYLQSTPMTEPVLAGMLAALLYCSVRFRESQSLVWVVAAGIAGMATALARYEGWSLIPLLTLYFLFAARRRRFVTACLFGALASMGPLLWLAHNWWYWGDALEFYHGPYSALAIYQRLLDAGMSRYRGDHNWPDAAFYYWNAVRMAVGSPVLWLGIAGMLAACFKRAIWPVIMLVTPTLLIISSIHSGGTPIYMPHLWPFSYWNTRFGVTALPALAFAAGALVALTPARFRVPAWLLIAGLVVVPWIRSPRPDAWICWKESQVNSDARRAWTKEAADFLKSRYRPGTGIAMAFGDLAGILREAGIPLRESLHEDNVPAWQAAVAKPGFFLWEEWAVTMAGDPVDTAIVRAGRSGPNYERVKTIALKGAPVINIYRRN